MKFRYQAVDSAGRIQRGVLRSESDEATREALLAAGMFAKAIAPAGDDEPVTWVARTIRPASEEAASFAAGRAGTVQCTDGRTRFEARLGFATDGRVLLERRGEAPRVLDPSTIESASLSGFPRRVLRIAFLDATGLDIDAGLFRARPLPRQVAAILSSKAR